MSLVSPGKYLVLGSSGLIGSSVLSRLQNREGVSVVSVYFSNNPVINAGNIEHVQMDLRQRKVCLDTMRKIDYVFHLSSNIILKSMSDDQVIDRMTSNVAINMNILESAYKAQIKKMLWVSSSTAYPPKEGDLVENEVFNEDPADDYFAVGWIHRFIEKMCVIYSQKNINKFPIAVVRPTCVYGENEGFDYKSSHLLPYLIRTIEENRYIDLWDNGEVKRDYIYVDDFVNACFTILGRKEKFETFNLGHGVKYSVNEIIDMICKKMNIYDLKIDRRQHESVKNERYLSLKKMKNDLNFIPSVSMSDGIQKLIDRYKLFKRKKKE